MKYKQLVLIEFHSDCPFLIQYVSDEPITLEAVVSHMKLTSNFNEENQDGLIFMDTPETVKLPCNFEEVEDFDSNYHGTHQLVHSKPRLG